MKARITKIDSLSDVIMKVVRNLPFLRFLFKRMEDLENQLDTIKSRMDISNDLYEKYMNERQSESYKSVYSKSNPLVTICVGTYNRSALLIERSVKSILNQTYSNIEVIVIGDCCTDETEALMAKVQDRRLYFVNLPERGKYPEEPELRWMVAGTIPFNYSLSMVNGDFITHLDDDDEYTIDRIEKLVKFIQSTRVDFVWHPFFVQTSSGKWVLNKAEEFKWGQVTTSSIFYHCWFKYIPWDINAYKYLEPGDWNRLRKIKYLGAKILRYPEPLLKHYKQMNQTQK